ncbi:MAG: tripartite tricarboxylate transporter substrate binding protein [Rhodoferax sp.]|jgi:tripartite-type tricarboxylate transporter receptor subunit TctC|nr:tripartite tricarboxylate transporter substrate binding protein [Rhodoferax sp.]
MTQKTSPHAATRGHCRRTLLAAAALVTVSAFVPVQAQSWPSKTVTIVSPYGPGGTNDVVARLFADRLSKALGQSFVVENKPGAAGILGATLVANAAPDGYTLLSGNNGALIVQSVVKNPSPYNTSTAFTPIAKLADAPNYVGVSAELPVNTVGELISLAKKEPGKLNYSSAGSGSFGNFMGEYLKMLSGVDIMHVPAKSSGPALTELMSGRIQLMIDPLVLSQRSSGRVKVLATTQKTRVDAFPDIPTIKESGGPEMEITGWFGLVGPAKLPKEIVDRIEGVARAMASDPEVRKTLSAAGLVPNLVTGSQFGTLIHDDLKRYTDVKMHARMVVE